MQLVFLTHRASERAVRLALSEMARDLVSKVSVIRVEGRLWKKGEGYIHRRWML